MDSHNAERSKLVQRQKQQRQDLEKKVKKLKGAMKEAAAKELEELDAKLQAELADFDAAKDGGSAAPKAAAAAPAAEEVESSSKGPTKIFRDRNWSGLSKKELEEACTERGIGKKGSKEDLITKLVIFQKEQAAAAPAAAESGAKKESKPAPKAADSDSEDEEDEEDEDESEDESGDESDDGRIEADEETMERQGKREHIVQKKIRVLFKEQCKDGFLVAELEEKLAAVQVQNFKPESLGYRSNEKFIKNQPATILRYNRKTGMVLPPKKAGSSSTG